MGKKQRFCQRLAFALSFFLSVKVYFFTAQVLMLNRMYGVWSTRKKRRIGVWVGTLIFNLDRSCVCSVQIPNLMNKTFLNFPYIFQVLKT